MQVMILQFTIKRKLIIQLDCPPASTKFFTLPLKIFSFA